MSGLLSDAYTRRVARPRTFMAQLNGVKPEIIAIIGDPHRQDQLMELARGLDGAGHLVFVPTLSTKPELRRRQIDLADRVLVANYTELDAKAAADVGYAKAEHKVISYLFPMPGKDDDTLVPLFPTIPTPAKVAA